MRYLFLLLFLGSSLCGMEKGLHWKKKEGVISPAEYKAAELWRNVVSSPSPPTARIEEVKRLLQAGLDPNMKIPSRNFPGCAATTPLHWASGSGLLDAVNYLLIYGADPKGCDGEGGTTLFQALQAYRLQDVFRKLGTRPPMPDMSVVKLLLLRGADPHNKDRCGNSVFDSIDAHDIELREMLENFETYKSNHAKEFDDIRYEHDLLRIKIEFENKLKRFGLRNTLSGICEPRPSSTRPNGLSGAGKRKRDDDEGFHSPRSHATFVEE